MRHWKKLRKGSVVGLDGKLHPAINQSIYEAGDKTPVFTVADITFGILICLDSNYEVTLTPYP
jgi:predicted amidohydrolase